MGMRKCPKIKSKISCAVPVAGRKIDHFQQILKGVYKPKNLGTNLPEDISTHTKPRTTSLPRISFWTLSIQTKQK
jgi:hypothetical protein